VSDQAEKLRMCRAYVQCALDRLIGSHGDPTPCGTSDANMTMHDLIVALSHFGRAHIPEPSATTTAPGVEVEYDAAGHHRDECGRLTRLLSASGSDLRTTSEQLSQIQQTLSDDGWMVDASNVSDGVTAVVAARRELAGAVLMVGDDLRAAQEHLAKLESRIKLVDIERGAIADERRRFDNELTAANARIAELDRELAEVRECLRRAQQQRAEARDELRLQRERSTPGEVPEVILDSEATGRGMRWRVTAGGKLYSEFTMRSDADHAAHAIQWAVDNLHWPAPTPTLDRAEAEQCETCKTRPISSRCDGCVVEEAKWCRVEPLTPRESALDRSEAERLAWTHLAETESTADPTTSAAASKLADLLQSVAGRGVQVPAHVVEMRDESGMLGSMYSLYVDDKYVRGFDDERDAENSAMELREALADGRTRTALASQPAWVEARIAASVETEREACAKVCLDGSTAGSRFGSRIRARAESKGSDE